METITEYLESIRLHCTILYVVGYEEELEGVETLVVEVDPSVKKIVKESKKFIVRMG